ncbi:MAG TPA: phosphatase PAP2 family protein [Abditibacteriaceae bacterium]
MEKRNKSLSIPTKLWMPLLSLVVLAFAGSDLILPDATEMQVGFVLGSTVYRLYIVASIGVLISLALRERDARPVWWALDVIVCTTLLVHIVKTLSALPRPSGSPSGFPSGHTTFAFALAWLCLEAKPRLAPLWFAVAIAIGWSRVETAKHFSYQVLVGVILGTACGWLATHTEGGVLFPRLLRRRRQRTPSAIA